MCRVRLGNFFDFIFMFHFMNEIEWRNGTNTRLRLNEFSPNYAKMPIKYNLMDHHWWMNGRVTVHFEIGIHVQPSRWPLVERRRYVRCVIAYPEISLDSMAARRFTALFLCWPEPNYWLSWILFPIDFASSVWFTQSAKWKRWVRQATCLARHRFPFEAT